MKMIEREIKKREFNELRKTMNTKWNINVKEARDGIGWKCLPKDINLVNNLFKNNIIFKTAIKLDEKYRVKNKELNK